MKQKTQVNYIYLIIAAIVLVVVISSCGTQRGCPSHSGRNYKVGY